MSYITIMLAYSTIKLHCWGKSRILAITATYAKFHSSWTPVQVHV